MNEQGIIQWLWDRGHFRNPLYPQTLDVQANNLSKLSLSHPVVRSAVASIQALDANLEGLIFQHHGRALQIDGDMGPATEQLMTLPRCGCPDYGVSEATGSGSWPVPGCDPKRPNRQREHSIRVNVNTRNMPYSVNYFWRMIQIARECAAEMGLAARYILDSPDPSRDCEIDVAFEVQPGPTIGYNFFPQRGTCQQTIQGRIDPGFRPNNIIVDATLWEHEQLGHGLGLQHTRGGIMNPSILTFSRLTWKGDPHEATMRQWFGGVTVPVDVTPNPEPPPPEPGPIPGPIEITDAQVKRVIGQLIDDRPDVFEFLRGKPGVSGPMGLQGFPGRDGEGVTPELLGRIGEAIWQAAHTPAWPGRSALQRTRDAIDRMLKGG